MSSAVSALNPPAPFPQDCSTFNSSSTVPKWYTNCEGTAGGCFSIIVPKEKEYNVGNTSFGASSGGGVKWCIDHIQGYIYSKIIDPAGAMYYEIDDILAKPNQCRFLVGAEKTPTGTTYHARTYIEAGLTCTLTPKGSPAQGVQLYSLAVAPTASL